MPVLGHMLRHVPSRNMPEHVPEYLPVQVPGYVPRHGCTANYHMDKFPYGDSIWEFVYGIIPYRLNCILIHLKFAFSKF